MIREPLFGIFRTADAGATYSKRNKEYFKKLEFVINQHGILAHDLSSNTGFMRRRNFPKTLALYEIFKQTLDMPGSIAEFGVHKGDSFFTWIHLLETFCPGDRIKKVYGFDHFHGYTNLSKADLESEQIISMGEGNILNDGDGSLIRSLIDLHDSDSFLPGVERAVLIDEDILSSAEWFAKENQGVRFSIINVDVNLYEPIKAVLENFWNLLLPGGILMFSGFTGPPWEGEARAIEEFFNDKSVVFKKFPFSPYPRAYIVK
ncbi:hypothetical protein N9M46_01070 [Gammaproteobacteria bacterium]|nr:hypothetical protein [Gammaproteobacteria bacterium]